QCGRLCFVNHGYRLHKVSGLAPYEHGVAATLAAARDDPPDRMNVTEIDDSVAELEVVRLDGLKNHCCRNCRHDGAATVPSHFAENISDDRVDFVSARSELCARRRAVRRLASEETQMPIENRDLAIGTRLT